MEIKPNMHKHANFKTAFLTLGVCTLCLIGLNGFSISHAQVAKSKISEGIVATVNDDIISSFDLRQRLLLVIATSGVQVTEANLQTYEQQTLRDLIDERLELQELKRFEVKVEESEINEELARMAQHSNMTTEQLVQALKSSGIGIQTLRAQIKTELGWGMLVNGRFRGKARVGQDQIASVMQKLTIDAAKPQYHVAEIYLDSASNGGIEQARQGAQQLYTQIAQGGVQFQAVARQFSNSPSANNGGEAGWWISGNINPALEATLTQLDKGKLSAPIETDEGVYILYLIEKTDGTTDASLRMMQASIIMPSNAPESAISSAQKQLANFRAHNKGCKSVKATKSGNGITVSDLGQANLSELQPDYAKALEGLKENESTPAMRNARNVNVIYVCERRLTGENAPSMESIEQKIVQDRVAMLGRRYLRDLRTTATIETR